MTTHISVRLAWHDNGWNGCVCRDPRPTPTALARIPFPATISLGRVRILLANSFWVGGA
jgi:hypothetical protein